MEDELPAQSPIYHALNSGRYERQLLISQYQDIYSCRLVVMADVIFDHSVPLLEELIYDNDPDTDLHIILSSPGGDGETAVRLVRAAQSRCRELTIIVPDQAKSAATLMTIGAHRILMGPSSDLGPIDAQFMSGNGLISAKDIIAAVDDADSRVRESPDVFPLYASLLEDVSAVMVQQARSALARSHDLLREALRSNKDRTDAEVESLIEKLIEPLIERPTTHAALFGSYDASKAGLLVETIDTAGQQWQQIWRLWTKYYVLGMPVYEGDRASHTGDSRTRDIFHRIGIFE